MKIEQSLITDIKSILTTARGRAYAAVNFAMVEAYWNIGRRIVEEEQKGEERAEYGAFLLKELSKRLSAELGKGFTLTNLKYFRQFYLTFSDASKIYAVRRELQSDENQATQKGHAVRDLFEDKLPSSIRKELTWTHYRVIMYVENPKARDYYIKEAADHNWSTRELERNINTMYYERILSSNKIPETPEKQSPIDFIKDPYIFEFLGIPQTHTVNELQLESALINNLKDFLLELGKGFSFVKRQYRINTDTKSFYIDLVFYNYILKCFVLFDLKTGELTHQDIGQMDMYVRMFDDLERTEGDNPTIGIILCTQRDQTIVKYSVLHGSDQMFATKYRSYLPTEEELIAEIEREKLSFNEKLKTLNQE